jgi:hypothetical protein
MNSVSVYKIYVRLITEPKILHEKLNFLLHIPNHKDVQQFFMELQEY